MRLTKTDCIIFIIGILLVITSSNQANSATLGETAISHYKRANVLVKRGNHRQAVKEYKSAYRLAPNSTVGKYSLRALAYYGLSREEIGIQHAGNSFTSQVDELKRKSIEDAKSRINSRAKHINAKLRVIDEEERASIEHINNNPSYTTAVVPHLNGYYPNNRRYYRGGFGNLVRTVDPVATQARINSVKADAKARKDAIRRRATGKADQLLASHAKRAQMLDETASNLQSQMFGKGVKLNPNGSNLYVRHYQ